MFSSLLSASSQVYIASRTLLVLSIFVAVFSTIVYAVKMRRFKAPGRLSFTGYILSVTLVSLLLLQISLAISASPEAKDGIAANYSVTQRITYSIQNTLQFFSLDADYTELVGKGEEVYNSVVFGKIYAVYGTLCTIAIPVIGLSVIFDILIAFIPGVKFFISFKNTKIIFSELNEKSIEVAESIAKKSFILRHYRRYKKYKEFCAQQLCEEDMPLIKRVCFRYLKWLFSEIDPDEEIQDNYAELRWAQIVFTDVYPDKMSEGKSELLDRAKLIGAICLKKDLLDRSVHFLCCPAMCSHLIYMLMDFEEENNFDSAVALMSEKQGLWAKTLGFVKNPKACKNDNQGSNCRIKGYITVYAFTRHPNAAKMISGSAPSHPHINIQTVNEYRNLVYSLIKGYDYENNEGRDRENYPLYYHLIEKVERLKKDIAAGNKATGALPDVKEKGNAVDAEAAADVLGKDRAEDSINIVIVGGGKIGGEFLRAALWCSQILSFRSKDEILAGEPANTIPVRITLIADNALDFKKRMNFEMPALKEFDATDSPSKKAAKEPTLIFRQAVFGSSDFEAVFDEEALDGHYFLVSLGDDYLNDAAAQWIKGRLKRDVDRAESTASIHYAIYNDDICRKLRMEESKNEGGSALYKKRKVVMHPFGSLRQFFNYSNICLNELDDKARYVHAAQSGENKLNPIIDDYAKQSSMANALHYEYKLFGTDMAYLNTVSGDDKLRYIKAIFDRQYWLEHWRWYLYMVTCGYRCPTVKEFLYLIREDNAYKELSKERGALIFADGQLCKQKLYDLYDGAKPHAQLVKHKEDMLLLHGCMVQGTEHYMKTEDWEKELEIRAKAVGKNYETFEKEFYIKLHASFCAVCGDKDAFDRYMLISDKDREIFKLLYANDKVNQVDEETTFGRWLKWLFEEGGEALSTQINGEPYELDALDALSFAMYILKPKADNFKDFDIATIRRIMSAMRVEETEKMLRESSDKKTAEQLCAYLNDLIDYSIGIEDQIIKVNVEADGQKREFSYCHIRYSKAGGYSILIRFEGELPSLQEADDGVKYCVIKSDSDKRIERLLVTIVEKGETIIARWVCNNDRDQEKALDLTLIKTVEPEYEIGGYSGQGQSGGVRRDISQESGNAESSEDEGKKRENATPKELILSAYLDRDRELQFKLKAVYERKISDNKK